MSYHSYDPGDCNKWYQSPQLGLFLTSPTGYSGGYYCLPSSHPPDTQFPSQPSCRPPPPQFPFQPSYSLPPPPSPHTIINGYDFPFQFPSTHTYHSPDSNPNPWIYPSISQSHSYDPSVTSVNSHFVSTKTMPTPPIYHSALSPLVCEQPHTLSYPNPFCPIPESGPSRISLQTDRIHNWEVPIVDSGGYSLIPEPTVKLKGAEKSHSPPQGSGKLQESLKSSMDTFISEFREELRLLRVSLQSPASQVDNSLKFGSPPPSPTPELIPAATEASSSLILADNGIIHKTHVDSGLNLSHTDVLLRFNDNTSTDHAVGFVFGIDENLENGEGESCDKRAKMNSGDGKELNQLEGVSVKQDDEGPSSCVKRREYHAPRLFDKMPKLNEWCNAGNGSSRSGKGLLESQGSSKDSPLSVPLPVTSASEKFESTISISEAIESLVYDEVDFQERDEKELEPEYGGQPKPILNSWDSKYQKHVSSPSLTSDLLAPLIGSLLPTTLPLVPSTTLASAILSSSMQNKVPSVFPSVATLRGSLPPLCTMEIIAYMVKYESFGRKIGRNGEAALLGHFSQLLPSIDSVSFSGFDKKVRDKGGGHILIKDKPFNLSKEVARNMRLLRASISNLIYAIWNLDTMASGNSSNSLKFTFSLIISLIEILSCGSAEKNTRLFTKISVTNVNSGCVDLHYDQGFISSGITFNSFLVHRNGECIVIRCSNLLQRMSKLQLYVEVAHGGISRMIHTSLSFKAAVDFSMCAIIEFSIVATLNVWLNGNLLCLLLENKSEKMSLLFADKFEKMEGNARMMLDDLWGRWKSIVMVANEYCTEELHVNFLEDCMKLNEKCLGYVLSTMYTPYTMQKLGFKFNYQNLYQLLFSLSKLEGDLSFQLAANKMDITPDDLLILEVGISCFQKLCDVALDYYHVESFLALLGEIERALLLCRRVLFPCFISELVKGDHQLQLFLPYDTLFVMGEAFTNSELLQHKYQFDPVDVMAVVATAIIQLQLNEATESYKRMAKHLRAFGICLSFNHLANHHSSNGPQVLIEQLVDIEFSVDIYEATMVHWLANYDEGPNWQGAKRTGTWFIKMHGFHHISTIKVLQQHTCLQHLQLVLRKIIQAETQVPLLVKKTILANEICEIQGNMDGSINADSPPIFSCFGDLALTMILYSLWLIRAWHKNMGYLPFKDSDYPTMPWFIYIFLGLGVTLCSGHGVADTAHGYGFQMTSCRGAQILIQNMKLEDKFV